MSKFEAGLDGVTFTSARCRLLGGFYRSAGDSPRPTALLLHGLPGIEKQLDIAYALRDCGWNCLYFHFRGCWGSEGAFDLAGQADDTRAALEFVTRHVSVDRDRIALIGGSTGFHPALCSGVDDSVVKALVGLGPLIEASRFQFADELAREFAAMLQGVTAHDLQRQWDLLEPLQPSIRRFAAARPILLVAADEDALFPPSQYADSLEGGPHLQVIRRRGSDHGFSTCRPWLVRTVTEWLVTSLGN